MEIILTKDLEHESLYEKYDFFIREICVCAHWTQAHPTKNVRRNEEFYENIRLCFAYTCYYRCN